MHEQTDQSDFLTYYQSNTNNSLKRNTFKNTNTFVKLNTNLQSTYSKLETLRRQQSLQTLMLDPYAININEKLDFQPVQVETVDHDIELKSYLSGQKIFKDSNQPLTNFLNQNQSQNTPLQLNYKIPKLKHKKQKSKSQINVRLCPHQKDDSFSRLHSIEKRQFPLKESLNFQSQPKYQKLPLKRNKTLQYLDIKDIERKGSIPAALEIQLVLKKVNQKKQVTLNDIVKKLNLPKVKLGGGVNLQKLIDNRVKDKQNLKILQRKNKTAQEIQKQKMSEANLTASIRRLQQSKINQLRKLERQILLSKMKSRDTKQKTVYAVKQNESKKQLVNIEKFYSLSK